MGQSIKESKGNAELCEKISHYSTHIEKNKKQDRNGTVSGENNEPKACEKVESSLNDLIKKFVDKPNKLESDHTQNLDGSLTVKMSDSSDLLGKVSCVDREIKDK